MARRIKPLVTEISLAFNPKNNKTTFIVKKGDEDMIEFLKSVSELYKTQNETINKICKDNNAEDIKDALVIGLNAFNVCKDVLAKNEKLMQDLAPIVKDLGKNLIIEKIVEKDISPEKLKAITEKIEKDLRVEYDNKFPDKGEVLKKDAAIKSLTEKLALLEKDNISIRETLNKATEEIALKEIVTVLKDANVPGNLEDRGNTYLALMKTNKDAAKNYLEDLKTLGVKVTQASSEYGTQNPGDISKDTALTKLQSLVNEKIAKDGLSFEKAYAAVVKENSDLYLQTRN